MQQEDKRREMQQFDAALREVAGSTADLRRAVRELLTVIERRGRDVIAADGGLAPFVPTQLANGCYIIATDRGVYLRLRFGDEETTLKPSEDIDVELLRRFAYCVNQELLGLAAKELRSTATQQAMWINTIRSLVSAVNY